MNKYKLIFFTILCLTIWMPTLTEAQSQTSNVELKQVEENLTQIAEQIGGNQLNELITTVQGVLDGEQPIQIDQVKEILLNEAEKMGLSLTEEQQQVLVNSFQVLQDMNVSWESVSNEIADAISQVEQFAQSEKGETFFQQIFSGIKVIFDAVMSLF